MEMKKVWIIVWGFVNFAFSGFLAQPLTKYVKKLFTEVNQADMGWLLDNHYSLLSFIAFGLIFLIVLGLTALLLHVLPKNRLKRHENKIRSEMEKYNNTYFQNEKIKATWEVVPEGLMDDNPFITNLQLFCLNENHQPVKMQNGTCPYSGCPNHNTRVNESQIKNMIESNLVLKKQSLRNQ